jgi:hypothetical protein
MRKIKGTMLALAALAVLGFLAVNCGGSSGGSDSPASASGSGSMDASLWDFVLQNSTTYSDYTNSNGIITVTAGTDNDRLLVLKNTPTDADVSILVTFQALTLGSGKGIRVFGRSQAAAEITNGSYMITGTSSAVKLYSRPASGSSAVMSSSPSQINSTISADGSTHSLFLKVIGSNITGMLDASSSITASDSTISSAGKVGIIIEKGCSIAISSAVIKTGSAADYTPVSATASPSSATASPSSATATATAPTSISWTSLDGSVLPSSANPAWTYSGTNSDPSATWTSSSGILTLSSTTAADTSVWKIAPTAFASSGKITALFRVQNTATANKGLDVMFNLGGSSSGVTVKFIVSSGSTGFQIEKADGTNSISDKTNVTVTNYNIYQVTIDYTATSATVNVYLNGSNTPLSTMTNVAVTRAASSNYGTLLIGDNGSNAYNSNLDYLIFTTDGCYTPSQVKSLLPSGIGDTTGY